MAVAEERSPWSAGRGSGAPTLTALTDQSVGLRGGQELTHLVLHPGEEIRTPLSVLLFYKGDWLRGQNLWRQWMFAHNIPHGADGKVPTSLLLACSSHQFGEMINANVANQNQFIDDYLLHGIKLDYWWMDAGWYVNDGSWVNIGTWEVDQKRFPGGLRHQRSCRTKKESRRSSGSSPNA